MRTFIEKFSKYEKKRKRGFVITVSGLTGAGKTTIAKAIAEELNLDYISVGEIFRKFAEENNIPFIKFIRSRQPSFDFEADLKTLEYAMRGNVVLDGRLTGWVAGDWADLRIWVRCPSRIRAKRVALRDRVSFDEAIRNIRRRDNADIKMYKKLYKIDLLDDSIYDMVIDTGRLSYEFSKKFPAKCLRFFYDENKSKSGSKF